MFIVNTKKPLICLSGNPLQEKIVNLLLSQFYIQFVDKYSGETGYIFDTTNTVAPKIGRHFAIITILSNPNGGMPSYVVSYPYKDFMNVAGMSQMECIKSIADGLKKADVFGCICAQVQKRTGLDINIIFYNDDDPMEKGLVDLLKILFHQNKCEQNVSFNLKPLQTDGLFVASNQTGKLIIDIKVDVGDYTNCGNFVVGNSVSVYSTPSDYGEGDIVKDALCIMTGIAESLLAMKPEAQQASILNGIIDHAHDYYLSGLAKDQQSEEDKVKDMISYVQGMIAEQV